MLDPHKIPHNSTYWVSFVNICEKMNRVMRAPQCLLIWPHNNHQYNKRSQKFKDIIYAWKLFWLQGNDWYIPGLCTLIARFMGPTWGPPGDDRTQVGPILAHEPCYLGTASRFLISTYLCNWVGNFSTGYKHTVQHEKHICNLLMCTRGDSCRLALATNYT